LKKINLRTAVIIGLLIALVVTPFLWMRTHPRSLTPMQIAQRDASMPPYQHIFVIVAENKSFESIMNHPNWTPVLHRLAAEYGMATQFYGEVHPSEGAYVAMLGGDTFGIHDDNPWYCRAGSQARGCNNSREEGYADHSVSARNLTDQLEEKGLTWKAYMEDVPADRLAPYWPSRSQPVMGRPNALYASKHNGFVNFRSVSRRPGQELARRIVGFQQLAADLAHDTMPNYAHIIPNECNEMHGLSGANVPPDCDASNAADLVRRGDAQIGKLVDRIIHSKVWTDHGNAAIVITFDESDGGRRTRGVQGCCGSDPNSAANFGGGHILTLVITNHGPRHVADSTPYNHYSLLRTTEAGFGIKQYLGQAANTRQGVVTMTPLFAVNARTARLR
jgi:phosphatidylinositol-3-phosphatase